MWGMGVHMSSANPANPSCWPHTSLSLVTSTPKLSDNSPSDFDRPWSSLGSRPWRAWQNGSHGVWSQKNAEGSATRVEMQKTFRLKYVCRCILYTMMTFNVIGMMIMMLWQVEQNACAHAKLLELCGKNHPWELLGTMSLVHISAGCGRNPSKVRGETRQSTSKRQIAQPQIVYASCFCYLSYRYRYIHIHTYIYIYIYIYLYIYI